MTVGQLETVQVHGIKITNTRHHETLITLSVIYITGFLNVINKMFICRTYKVNILFLGVDWSPRFLLYHYINPKTLSTAMKTKNPTPLVFFNETFIND